MTDRPTDPTQPTDSDRQADRLTIKLAAAHFGVSENAIWQRIKRGTLHTVKVSGRTYVLIDGQPATDPRPTDRQTERPTETDRQPTEDHNAVITELRGTITRLEQDNQRLWGEVEARRQAEGELRIIIANLTDSLKALPAQTTTDDRPADPVVATATPTPQTRWWRFWERNT